MSLILSRRDLDFVLFEWLAVEDLLSAPRYSEHDRETLVAVMDLAEKLAEQHFLPANRIADRDEPKLSDGGEVVLPVETAEALAAFAETGLLSASQPAEIGGGQLPFVIDRAAFAWLQAASPAISGYGLLSAAAANLLITHGSPEQIDKFAKPLLAGETFGTMCLSEPQAGSSLGDIATTAVPDGTGRYRLFGNKMWISGADHALATSITHLVLARVRGAAPGTKGLSLFLVPRDVEPSTGSKVRNDVVVAALNHKMGQRGTVNAALNFGEGAFTPDGEAGAIGYLVGSEGQGLSLMFTMMNEARIGVGMSAAAIGYTGFLHSADYARTRLQGRLAGQRDPGSAPVPIIEHPDVRRMLLIQKAYVEGALALNLYCARLVDQMRCSELAEERDAKVLLLDLLTPVAKSWPSEFCLLANSLAIQVHGGYGYTRDFPVEQFYRDNRLNAIHEGTHGIQALDLLGRKVTMASGAALDIFAAEVRTSCDRASALGDEIADHAEQVEDLLGEVVAVTRQLHRLDPAEAVLANASPYLETFGHLVIGWIWLEQLIAAHGKAGDFYDGKRAAARYFLKWELPKARAVLARIGECDRTVLDTPGHWL
ncbi:acyl-CoA dehydrogenase [Novosphingobium sp. JCM 18896]|uniref:acyl-CoA dehydrogenase n=1 Tax=Novosphingobium sp. JCM 18896 TaxID=2989731 RepID=UPI0022228CC6|nr:acyl-CoA dehydrogenase [Novosphingobium sp. JCM 18896]MCW1432358.1 acyl-CoA dehydrogenase [Novosphingobium sp. JCM 18896]